MDSHQHARALRQVQRSLYNRADTIVNKYEVCGRLEELIQSWEGEEHEACTSRHESDASNNTRREESEDALRQRKGSGGKGKGFKSPPILIEKSLASPKSAPKKEDKKPSTQEGWTTVTCKANKAKPGDVVIGTSSPKVKKQPFQTTRATTPPATKRDAGVIRVEITREEDWQDKVGVTTQELIEQVREVVGDRVASQIGSIKVYEGGDLKITPRARATDLQRDLTWIDIWIPSAVPTTLKWKEIVVHGVPYEGSADEVLDQLWIQNDDAVGDYRPGACKWLGKPEQSRKKAALRIKLSSAKEANDLIVNGVFLDYAHLKVSRYWSDGSFRGRARSPLFSLSERAEVSEDRIEQDDESFRDSQPSSPSLSTGSPLQGTPVPIQEILEVPQTSRESSTSSESSGQKRMREPSPSGEREAPKRGRPLGATNLPKFRLEKRQGESPFAIAKGQTQSGNQSLGTQVPAT